MYAKFINLVFIILGILFIISGVYMAQRVDVLYLVFILIGILFMILGFKNLFKRVWFCT